MEARHTAGPWRQAHVVSAYERKRRVIIAAEESQHAGVPVCEVYGVNDDDCVANAKLITAAPELLEAIQAALRIEPLWMPPDDENSPEYDAEFAALAMMRNQFNAVVAKVV